MLLDRHRRVLSFLALAALPLLAALEGRALAQTTLIEDGELFLTDWTMVVTSTGGSWGASRPTGNGNPGAYRRVYHHHDLDNGVAVPVRLESRHWYDAEGIDPDDEDPFESLTFTFDAFALEGNTAPVGLMRSGVAVLINQGNRVFRSRQGFSGPWSGAWQQVRLAFLVPADFLALDGAPGLPDFSEDAAPFSVGFFVGTLYSQSAPVDHFVGVDNFHVEANPVDGPPVVSFDRTLMTRSADGQWVVVGTGSTISIGVRYPAEMLARVVLSHPATQFLEVTARFEEDGALVPLEFFPGDRSKDVHIRFPVPDDGGASRHLRIISAPGGIIDEPRELLAQAFDRDTPQELLACSYCLHDMILFVLGYYEHFSRDCLNPFQPGPPAKATGADNPVQTLRALRDELMVTTAAGRYYAGLYKVLSPAIGRAILSRPSLALDIFGAQGAWLDGFAAQLAGQGASFAITQKMADDMGSILAKLKQAGTPSLARAIAHEEQRLGLGSIAGLTISQLWQRVNERGGPEACAHSSTALCLNGGRFRVETDWETTDGKKGSGHAVSLAGDSGYFWFFDAANVESVVKVLDGCGLNRRFWAFAAGLTDVRVFTTVTDTWTGVGMSYENQSGTAFAPIQDTNAIDACGAAAPLDVQSPRASPLPPVGQPSSPADCAPSGTVLCLRNGRYRVTAEWETSDGHRGSGEARPLTTDTGTFWFFDPGNTEVIVKVLDGCGLNQRHWVFAGGMTNVRVTLRVTDTSSGESKTYVNPLGKAFQPIQDTGALQGCS